MITEKIDTEKILEMLETPTRVKPYEKTAVYDPVHTVNKEIVKRIQSDRPCSPMFQLIDKAAVMLMCAVATAVVVLFYVEIVY